MAELRCEGVQKSYGERSVLREVGIAVPEGTLTAILGASGSGKTTLLRIVMGLVRPDGGRVWVGGSLVDDAQAVNVVPEKRAIGYVAQEGALFPHLTVAENVGFGLSRSERRRGARVDETLALVGLDRGYRTRRPHELSGGEQRRVALARALAPRPRLVLLDEPFSGLDAALRSETRAAVMHALAQGGATAVLVTHDQAEALSMGREVAVLRDGALVQQATPTVLYRSPADAELAGFLGEAILLPGTAAGGRVRCVLGELPIAAAGTVGPVEVMVRPEQVRIVEIEGQRTGEEEHTRGRERTGEVVGAQVIDHIYYGPHTVVRLALVDHPGNTVTALTHAYRVPAAGGLVGLWVRGPVVVYPPPRRSVPALPVDPGRQPGPLEAPAQPQGAASR